MAQIIGNNQIRLNSGQVITPQEGGWYDARRYLRGQLLSPGEYEPGKMTSNEVVAQTNPANIEYIKQQQQQLAKTQPITTPTASPTPSSVVPSGGGTTGAIPTVSTPAALDTAKLYESIYNNSQISDWNNQLATKEKQYLEAKAKISDNPFLSASSVDKRLARLADQYNVETAPLRTQVANAKADAEVKMNLALKQYDINNEAYKQKLDQFNNLLSMGALSNASDQDIANLAVQTGMSTSMIQSAVNASKQKNVKTHMITSTNNQTGEVTITMVDENTGEIIKSQSLGNVGERKTTGTGSNLTATQERSVIAAATKSLSDIDDNEDKLISLDEYKKALQKLIAATGIDSSSADNYLTQQMQTLGYGKWRW
jgi:hypothetical protein